MTERKALSKKARFEIFKRDGFTCQYCGKQPPDVILEVDHIKAVSNGGDNDPLNLITSCFECNRGKGAKELGNVAPKPDADIEWLSTQQEIAELKRYQEIKTVRDDLYRSVAESLQKTWAFAFRVSEAPHVSELVKLLNNIPPEIIEKAIYIASGKMAGRQFYQQYQYMCGICWNMVNEKEEGN